MRVESSQSSVSYPRVARWQTPTDLKVALVADAAGAAEVELQQSLMGVVQVEHVQPRPHEVRASQGGARFLFHADAGRTAQITFTLKPHRPALLVRSDVLVNGGERFPLNMTILP